MSAPIVTKEGAYGDFNKLLSQFVGTLDKAYSKYERGLTGAKKDLSDVTTVDPRTPLLARAAAPVFLLNREKLYDEKDRTAIVSGVKNLFKSVDIDKIMPHVTDVEFGMIRRWILKLDLKLDVIYRLDTDLLKPETKVQFLALPKTCQNPAAVATPLVAPPVGVSNGDNKSTSATAAAALAPVATVAAVAPSSSSSSSSSSITDNRETENKAESRPETKESKSSPKKTKGKKKRRNPTDELAPMLNIMNQFMGSEIVQSTLQGKNKDDTKTGQVKDQFSGILSTMGDQLEKFARSIGDAKETQIPESERQMRAKTITTGLLGLVGMDDPSMYTDPKTLYERELSMARDRAAKTDPNRYDTVILFNRDLVAGLRMLYENRVAKFPDKFPKLKVKLEELFSFYEIKGNMTSHAFVDAGLQIMQSHEESVLGHDDTKLFLCDTRPDIFRLDGIEVPRLVRSVLYYPGSDKVRKGQRRPVDDPSAMKFWKIVDTAASFLCMYRNFKKEPFAPLNDMVNDFMTRNKVTNVSTTDAKKTVQVTRDTMYDAMANIGANPERASELRKSAATMLRKGRLEDCIAIVVDAVAPQSRKLPEMAALKKQMSEMTAPLLKLQEQQRHMDAELERVAKEAKEKGEDVDKAVAETQKRLTEERDRMISTVAEESKAAMEKIKLATEQAQAASAAEAKKKGENETNGGEGEGGEDEGEEGEGEGEEGEDADVDLQGEAKQKVVPITAAVAAITSVDQKHQSVKDDQEKIVTSPIVRTVAARPIGKPAPLLAAEKTNPAPSVPPPMQ